METTKNFPQYVDTFRPTQFKFITIAQNFIQTAPKFKSKFVNAFFQIETT